MTCCLVAEPTQRKIWRKPRIVSLSRPSRSGLRSVESESECGLEFRLEHVPDHCGQLGVEPFVELFTRQLFWPSLRISHPAVELLLEDPLPSVVDKELEILQVMNALDKANAGCAGPPILALAERGPNSCERKQLQCLPGSTGGNFCYWSNLHGCVPDDTVNFADILWGVLAFQSDGYADYCDSPCP
jgi:hypothetical protein